MGTTKYKSRYFTSKKCTRKPCLRTIKRSKKYHELIIYSMIIYDVTTLLTREASTGHAASEIRF